MDIMAQNFSDKHENLTIVGLRYFNVYGPGEFYKNKTSSMIIQLGHQILSGKNPRLFYDSDKILRDFVYIEDAIQANILSCTSSKSGVFNVGSGTPRSFKDIVDIIQRELRTDYAIEYFNNPYSGYQTHTQADINSTIKYLNYSPSYSLEQGIKRYLPEIQRTVNLENT